MNENKRVVKCKKCNSTFNVWNEGVISNAWQKNDINHYEYTCSCGEKGVLRIPIEK